MAKAKKVTTTDVIKSLGLEPERVKIVKIGKGENAIEIAVKSFLTIQERVNIVREISDMVFTENFDGVEEYTPALKKFARDYAVVKYFTNISLPSKAESVREFLEVTKIADTISDTWVGGDYMREIFLAVDAEIENRREILAKRSKFDSLIEAVLGIVKAFDGKIGNMDISQMAEMLGVDMPELKGEFEQLVKSNADESISAE